MLSRGARRGWVAAYFLFAHVAKLLPITDVFVDVIMVLLCMPPSLAVPHCFTPLPRLLLCQPSNIFAKKGRDGATVYKIGDMGLACVATAVQGVQIEEGDVRYLAPEIFAGEHDALPKADVFSLGASLLALTIQRDLEGNGVEWHNLRSTEFDVKSMLPDHCTTPFAELLCKLMNPVVSSRPTIEQVLANDLLRRFVHDARVCVCMFAWGGRGL